MAGNVLKAHVRSLGMLIWLVGLTAGDLGLLQAAPPKVISSAPAHDIDQLVAETDGWIGADGAYSVEMPSGRIVWLFSDTWIGKIRDGRRVDATMVNNTIGIQSGPREKFAYFIGRNPDGQPKAMIVPADGRGWYWLQSGLIAGGKLSLFLNQVEKTGDDSVFGFRSTGLWLGTVENAELTPDRWQVIQVKMPNVIFAKDRILVWGAANLRVDADLFILGIDERRESGKIRREMVVARAPAESLSDFSTWKYYQDGAWVEDFRHPSPLAGRLGNEFSVTPFEKGYLAVYTDEGLSPKIMGRMSDHPWGPWSEPVVLHTCSEMGRDKNLFCYSAKAHSSLSHDHEIILCYFVNSFDFRQIAREADLYWPRFVRVTLGATDK